MAFVGVGVTKSFTPRALGHGLTGYRPNSELVLVRHTLRSFGNLLLSRSVRKLHPPNITKHTPEVGIQLDFTVDYTKQCISDGGLVD